MHGRPGRARGSDRAVTVVGTTVGHAVVQGRAGVVRASLALVCAVMVALQRRAAMALPAVTTSASVSPSVVAGTQAGAAGGQGSSFAAPKRSLTIFAAQDGRCARSSEQRPSVGSVEDSWIQLSTHVRSGTWADPAHRSRRQHSGPGTSIARNACACMDCRSKATALRSTFEGESTSASPTMQIDIEHFPRRPRAQRATRRSATTARNNAGGRSRLCLSMQRATAAGIQCRRGRRLSAAMPRTCRTRCPCRPGRVFRPACSRCRSHRPHRYPANAWPAGQVRDRGWWAACRRAGRFRRST